MILELDAGNTRIKWRLMKPVAGGLVKEASGFVLADKKNSAVLMELSLQLDKLSFTGELRIRVSSVRGENFKLEFLIWANNKWDVQAEFAEVEKSCGGVSNSYNNVSAMGVDRWLAMLAAFDDAKSACCIIDCGSAITLDLIDAKGQHQGGYIVPGFLLMKEALARKSSVLNINDNNWDSTNLGCRTGDAIRNGIMSMVLGLLERVHIQYQNSPEAYSWYLTGGDAELIAPHVTWEHKIVSDLVLDGLAISRV
jgi:type III pantothenate kinase